MEIKRKIQNLIRKLKNDDKYYMEKIDLLHNLLRYPDIGHVISKDIADWCNEVGLKPEYNCEDGASWWSCSAE
jgi:hypothetical protein